MLKLNKIWRLLLGFWERASNVVVTVAFTTGSIFYIDTSDEAINLCGSVDGILNVASVYIRCGSLVAGRFVQVQNSITNTENFHLNEVEVFGF